MSTCCSTESSINNNWVLWPNKWVFQISELWLNGLVKNIILRCFLPYLFFVKRNTNGVQLLPPSCDIPNSAHNAAFFVLEQKLLYSAEHRWSGIFWQFCWTSKHGISFFLYIYNKTNVGISFGNKLKIFCLKWEKVASVLHIQRRMIQLLGVSSVQEMSSILKNIR